MTTPDPKPVTKPTMWCRKCWYILDGLDRHRCPECGREFDPANLQTYRTKPRRRWWRAVLLRTAAVLLVLLVMGGGWTYWRYTVEQRAMVKLRSLGIVYHEERAPLGPGWLTDWATQRDQPVLKAVGAIWMLQAKDTDLRHLRRLTKLQELNLSETKVTDAGIADLKRALPNLRVSK